MPDNRHCKGQIARVVRLLRFQMITRVHLGASRFDKLPPRVLPAFLDASWMHLGDEHDPNPYTFEKLRGYSIPVLIKGAVKKILGGPRRDPSGDDPYAKTNFRPWFYRKGDRLPFEDDSINYIYSEHVLMYFFLDEAVALLRECRRVLAPGGVVRTVVPDADLRTYEPPEAVGYPRRSLPFTDPRKIRTRYSVYMLGEALRVAGLDPVPVRYCDLHGNYIEKVPADLRDVYGPCPDPEIVLDFTHVARPKSLIVDGVKRCDEGSSAGHAS